MSQESCFSGFLKFEASYFELRDGVGSGLAVVEAAPSMSSLFEVSTATLRSLKSSGSLR